jgi:hypothetical protein
VEELAPSEMNEETADTVTVRDVGAPATLGSLLALTERRIFIVCILLCQDEEKRLMVVYLD